MFSEEQKNKLEAPLFKSNVLQREQGKTKLSYIEGWWAIHEANRIFGFGEWERETEYCKEVSRVEITIGKTSSSDGYPGWKVGYEAKVRIVVRDENGDRVARTGIGLGSGTSRDLFDAIEGAAKEAETDAMKRALMTFGNPFGLALYDKKQRYVLNDTPTANQLRNEREWQRVVERIDRHDNPRDLEEFANGKLKEMTSHWPDGWLSHLREYYSAHMSEIKAKEQLGDNDDTITNTLAAG